MESGFYIAGNLTGRFQGWMLIQRSWRLVRGESEGYPDGVKRELC
jgi:hypothetical protein